MDSMHEFKMKEQVLWHGGEAEMNSIGGIVNHIMVHVRRNTAKLMDPTITYKQGMEDSFTPSVQDKAQLMTEVEEAFSSFCAALDDTGAMIRSKQMNKR